MIENIWRKIPSTRLISAYFHKNQGFGNGTAVPLIVKDFFLESGDIKAVQSPGTSTITGTVSAIALTGTIVVTQQTNISAIAALAGAYGTIGDLYLGSTSLILMNESGTNGTNTFIDQSPENHVGTAGGTLVWSTTAPPQGLSSSASMTNLGDAISFPETPDLVFGGGDFTIEFFYKEGASNAAIITKNTVSSTNREWYVYYDKTANIFQFYASSTGSTYDIANGVTIGSSTGDTTWTYVAISRSGSTWTTVVGSDVPNSATTVTSFTSAASINNSFHNAVAIGGDSSTGWARGNIAGVRLTKGIARDVTKVPKLPYAVPANSNILTAEPVKFDVVSTSARINTTDTFVDNTITVANNLNRALVLFIYYDTTDPTISGVAHTSGSGGTWTRVGYAKLTYGNTSTPDRGQEIWVCPNPSVGVNTIRASITGTAGDTTLTCYSIYSTDTSSLVYNYSWVRVPGANTPFSTAVPTPAGGMVLWGNHNVQAGGTPSGDFTTWETSNGGNSIFHTQRTPGNNSIQTISIASVPGSITALSISGKGQGTVGVTGTIAATQTANISAIAVAHVSIGTIAVTQTTNVSTITATNAITGTIAVTQNRNITNSALIDTINGAIRASTSDTFVDASITVAANSNRALVAYVYHDTDTTYSTGLTHTAGSGDSWVLRGYAHYDATNTANGLRGFEIWTCTNPSSGVNTVRAALSATAGDATLSLVSTYNADLDNLVNNLVMAGFNANGVTSGSAPASSLLLWASHDAAYRAVSGAITDYDFANGGNWFFYIGHSYGNDAAQTITTPGPTQANAVLVLNAKATGQVSVTGTIAATQSANTGSVSAENAITGTIVSTQSVNASAITAANAITNVSPTITFDFNNAASTTLATIDARWSEDSAGDLRTNGSGQLQAYAGTNIYNIRKAWFVNGQGALQKVSITTKAGPQASAELRGAAIQVTSSQLYHTEQRVGGGLNLYRNAVFQVAGGDGVGSDPTLYDSVITLEIIAGGVVKAYKDGVLMCSFTDGSPLTGGYPGMRVYCNGTASSAQIDSFTDQSYPATFTQSANTAAISGTVSGSNVTGTIATAQAVNISSVSAENAITGTIASTQSVNASVITAANAITGTIAAIQAVNVSTIVSTNTIIGTIVVVQTTNASAITATNLVSGTLATTQTKNTAILSGLAGSYGTIAATQQLNISAIVSLNLVSGTLASTQNVNVTVITSTNPISGTVATTGAKEVSAIASAVSISGTLGATGTSCISAISGTVTAPGAATGTIVTTQNVNVSAMVGSVAISGTIAATNSSNISAIAASVAITGTLAATQLTNVSAITAANRVSGTVVTTQAVNVSSITASNSVSGTIAATQAANTSSMSGSVITGVSGSISAVQTPNTAAMVATLAVAGTLAVTSALQTSNIVVTTTVSGTLAGLQTKGGGLVSGGVSITGTVSSQNYGTMSGAGGVLASGILATTGNVQLASATGTVFDPTAIGNIAGVQQSGISAITGISLLTGSLSATQAPTSFSSFMDLVVSGSLATQSNKNGIVVDGVVVVSGVIDTHSINVLRSIGFTSIVMSSLSALRLYEIWQRLELDKDNPVVLTDNGSLVSLNTGQIAQSITDTSVVRGVPQQPTPTEAADTYITEIWQRLGLDPANPITQNEYAVNVAAINIAITQNDPTTTVTRL